MTLRIHMRDELVEIIRTKVLSAPRQELYHHFRPTLIPALPAPYTLIVGAGFSAGVVPLVRELMTETIGDYFIPDQDQSSLPRPSDALRRHSRDFWRDFNRIAAQRAMPAIAVDNRRLPVDPGVAYQTLFSSQAVLAEMVDSEPEPPPRQRYVERLRALRYGAPPVHDPPREPLGDQFLRGFLRYVIDPGSEFGHGSTGRNALNPAHSHLAAILEAQQRGQVQPFCRTILTTNFDTLLQNALQEVRLLYRLTDRPERGFDSSEFEGEEMAIHLVYVHGSILRHNPASASLHIADLAERNVDALTELLRSRDTIIVGYSGWRDVLSRAIARCGRSGHTVYWCDVRPQPPGHVAELLGECSGEYVDLGSEGADGLMRSLCEALIPG